MADFSKEYVNKYFHEHEGDFSIEEEYSKLGDEYYISIICEGYGFRGILNQHGKCKLIYIDKDDFGDDVITLVAYDKLDEYYTTIIKKKGEINENI